MTSPQFAPRSRRMLGLEVLVVLGLSLGASAVYSIVRLVANLTLTTPLGSQTATINGSLSDRPTFDLIYQLLAIFFALLPVVLAFYLLALSGVNPFRQFGFDARRPVFDVTRGLFLVLVIGVPGIALYFVGRALGITVNVVPAPLDSYWWTVPVLILSALRAALTEELIVVGYLYERLARFGWHTWTIILSTAVLRGSYHLYQGIGPFIGNVVMGVVFGWLYLRWGRVVPLVIAHWIIDIASFVGYAWALATFPQFF
ncbi:CPBP family intramembrane metalloprotease domain-containing protein [Subtercola boreus]|uniref:CPBP family intramembrane metalloprotease domain-containing protein n=1 Tax=Subtercola boreus TaxID=120213 RepID=A0A3E0VVE8_9MICO|nr:CPBP family intramembrane glutamic endopeptidase [Subtercola boreus]RFA14054.1 CPBP family intramembrane metalloprotease domain-containing protein [Subtercola boreus]